MVTESRYAYLSADLVSGRGRKSPFVHHPDCVAGTRVLFPGFGLEAQEMATGVLKVQYNGHACPTLLVDDENFFQQVVPKDKYHVMNLRPREWRAHNLVVVDMNWAYTSLIADAVIQSFLVRGESLDNIWTADDKLPDPARRAAVGFLAQDLDKIHRKNWYDWLQVP